MIGKNKQLTYRSTAIIVKKCHPNAKIPQQESGDVGFDVSCVEDISIQPGKTLNVQTGLMLAETPEPMVTDNKIVAQAYLKIEGRSGMAANGVFPVGGIIDPRYRGEIGVVLFNSTDKVVSYKSGSRIAQFVVYYVLSNMRPHSVVKFLETDEVSQTDRGDKGFGSTGA